jgi:hypothetical protein
LAVITVLRLEANRKKMHKVHLVDTIVQTHTETSLNMFKHYKLRPSFPIIKDNKTKDRAGVGDKPPPQIL